MTKTEKLQMAVSNGETINEETHAIGGGQWSIEVYGSESGLLFELIGLNGTQEGEEADDLHGELSDIWAEIKFPETPAATSDRYYGRRK